MWGGSQVSFSSGLALDMVCITSACVALVRTQSHCALPGEKGGKIWGLHSVCHHNHGTLSQRFFKIPLFNGFCYDMAAGTSTTF